MATHKVCSKCKIEKPVAEFGKSSRNKDRLRAECKACRKIESATDFQKHKAKRLAKHREWMRRNPAAQNGYVKAYQTRDPARTKSQRDAANRKRDPRKHREQSQRDHVKHRDKRLTRHRQWRRQNKEVLAESNRAWRRANPDLCRANSRNYKARKKGAVGTHTAADIADIRRLQRDRCAMCGVHLYGKGHVDHIRALVNGGTNDRRNIQILCQPCNNRKHAKDEFEFARLNGLLL